jgi:hypothetical protein
VLGELLRNVQPLQSDEPTEILRFFVSLKGIYDLQLASDRLFMLKLLPKLKGACLNFLGGCIRRGDSWELCKKMTLEELFPIIVRERLIRELIVFTFHSKEVPLRTYIDEIVDAAEFLNYLGT